MVGPRLEPIVVHARLGSRGEGPSLHNPAAIRCVRAPATGGSGPIPAMDGPMDPSDLNRTEKWLVIVGYLPIIALGLLFLLA